MLRFLQLLFTTLFLSVVLVYTGTCHAADTVRINGSGNALDMMQPLINAYIKTNHNAHIVMAKPLGSSGAIKALLADALDMAIVSRDLKTEEAAQGAMLMRYGKTPFVIVTEKSVHRSGISTKELEDIYTGKTGTWQEGKKIRVVLRPLADIDTLIMRGLSPGMNSAITASHTRPGMVLAITDLDSYATIKKTPGGIGATGMNSIISEKLPLTMLSLNGIKPSLKNLASGAYPLAKEISFVTTAKTTPATWKLIDFIFSAKGRAIAGKAGVLVTAGVTERSKPH
ncbi:MAG: substrate-binding domain-containing protein [Desulfuromonadaceae bacterium]|nr:substrate-binding domain-containing protein [Desulfuromonadaceae bacterium]MDD2847183.1 substrate-binding domain-containing protein [Desulfuromonadaceae bacterium]MDD4130127.1 substrate-binding domain-containing protein [Desulfuromonadaceae bacterium]